MTPTQPRVSDILVHKKGFTLIEVLVFVVIVGIIAGVYLLPGTNPSNLSLEAAVRRIQSDLRYAQQLAVTTSTNHGAIFTGGGNYELYRETPGNRVIDPVTRQLLIGDMSQYAGVSIVSNQSIEFNTSGKPTSLTNVEVQLVNTTGTIKSICIIKNTGAAEIDFPSC